MRRQQPEAEIQVAIVEALRLVLGRHYLVVAVPNGGQRSRVEAAIMQRTGTLAGAGDLVITGAGFSGWMEVKANGPKLSKAQIAFRWECAKRGIPYAVVNSIDAALETCVAWGIAARSQDGAVRALPSRAVGALAGEPGAPRRGDAGECPGVRGVQGEGGTAAGLGEEVLHG